MDSNYTSFNYSPFLSQLKEAFVPAIIMKPKERVKL
jgi:hypothetical protein